MHWIFAVSWTHKLHWADPAAWLASIGTVGTLFFALLQYRHNSKEAEKRIHEKQAKNITAWIESNTGLEAWLAISNQSENPIYEVVLTLVPFQGSGDPDGKNTPINFRAFLSVVPPGIYYARTNGHTGMHFHPSVNVVFTDNSGNNWVRSGRGDLSEIDESPVDYFGLSRPVSWTFPVNKIPASKSQKKNS